MAKPYHVGLFFLSLVVVFVQTAILLYLALHITDIAFCGDIVRFINGGSKNIEDFFKKKGSDVHGVYQDMWEEDYAKQARDEIAWERKREFPSHYYPSCDEDSVDILIF